MKTIENLYELKTNCNAKLEQFERIVELLQWLLERRLKAVTHFADWFDQSVTEHYKELAINTEKRLKRVQAMQEKVIRKYNSKILSI